MRGKGVCRDENAKNDCLREHSITTGPHARVGLGLRGLSSSSRVGLVAFVSLL